jgi:hypothetical protein
MYNQNMNKNILIQDDPEFLDLFKHRDVFLLRKKYPILFDNRPITDKRYEFNINKNELKRQIIERDGDKCKVCGNKGEQVDHVIPLANNKFNKEKGMKPIRKEGKLKKVPSESFGSNNIENLRWVCEFCNRKKWTLFE